MKVFITWSGETSKVIATALHRWIPTIIQAVQPFLSEADIQKGTRWEGEVSVKLNEAEVGIICLTPDNLRAPWLLFEAGALSRKAKPEQSRVYTYLHNLKYTDIEQPLAMFQHTIADQHDTRRMLSDMRAFGRIASPADEEFNALFDMIWPKLEGAIQAAPRASVTRTRQVPEMVEEILNLVRDQQKRDTNLLLEAIGRSYTADLLVQPNVTAKEVIAKMLSGGGLRRDSGKDRLLRDDTDQSS